MHFEATEMQKKAFISLTNNMKTLNCFTKNRLTHRFFKENKIHYLDKSKIQDKKQAAVKSLRKSVTFLFVYFRKIIVF